ncbi:hypothetical protein SPRG_04133 [Saprolegnia parasitica CBS 223.65]|uniref:Dynein assembly factor 3, axonemal n=1 Tax=Saprolegnia parasitica (strain CBS 223.65) TaxID=695850 RepID=A0A067CNW4_SAPPC|nr:hypothetical protein SPRG_04133 [Saprolegnia parasitica CBS 223.65]KDO30945.1 hypothetical protein SPRG_04133 [Saprolegnia parasitica CBS 223.65]|eukprot:XP_012198129.1 hypothetical protein SPRG_04133 [Saprolegnia parasitica CBS 223.65]
MTSKTGNLLSLGTLGMWGFSPAFDLHEGVAEPATDDQGTDDDTTPLSLLVVNPGDIRHVLTTISRSRRWQKRPLHIYLFEKANESLARALLLLQIVHEWELPLRQRCNTFLEVFGNALLQERTSEFIEEKAKELVELVCNEHGRLADLVDVSHLKMKDRDALVETFQSWHTSVPFDIVKLRDHRLRHFYENRYDYRANLFDWDYTMSLKKIDQASVIHARQFKEWRNSGIAFEFGDQTYTSPNRSMASYTEATKRGHGSVLCRGFWLDITVGPYISFGVDCFRSNKFADGLFEIYNKGSGCEQNRHNTAEVAVFNVLSCLHEIETGDIYKMAKAHDVYSGIGEDDAKVVELDESNQTSHDDDERDARKRARNILETLGNAKITLLTGNLDDVLQKSRYRGLFDHVHLSVHASHLISKPALSGDAPAWTSILKPRAKVSVESSVFLLPFKEDQRLKYMEKLVEFAASSHLTPTKKDAFTLKDVYDLRNAVLNFEYTA